LPRPENSTDAQPPVCNACSQARQPFLDLHNRSKTTARGTLSDHLTLFNDSALSILHECLPKSLTGVSVRGSLPKSIEGHDAEHALLDLFAQTN